MQKRLLALFHQLGIEELKQIDRFYELKGDFINLECKLPNGQFAKLLDDGKLYYSAEVCKTNSSRCYGIAGDAQQLVVYEYGENGTDAELVLWKRI